MVKYDVLLCSEVFSDCYIKSIYQVQKDQLEIGSIIKNHRLVLSNNILRIYENYARDHGLLTDFDCFKQWYTTQAAIKSSEDIFIYINDKEAGTENIDEVFTIVVKEKIVKKPIIICALCPRCMSFCQSMRPILVMSYICIPEQTIDNPLRRNVLPFAITTKQGDQIDLYLEWFREVLAKQNTIHIFDRYAYKSEYFKTMVQFVIQQVEFNACIKIYIHQSEAGTPIEEVISNNKVLRKLADERKITIQIYSYRKGETSYHDRRIFLQTSNIILTYGFRCLLVGNDRRTLKHGQYTISHNQCNVETEIDNLSKEYPYYEEFWDTTKEPEDVEV